MENSTIPNPRDFIEEIRRDEFGIGASLGGEASIVVNNYARREQSALATIADDLNSKELHFILELVQNADDNQYEDGVAPSLTFKLESNSLVVVNNERGFSTENVKALCSAGESSKKNKKGYIGEKGIGFKSVFKVTDEPEIHSNGYHFKFIRDSRSNSTDSNNNLGYVVPHWHEPTIEIDDGQTTIVLPAKPGSSFDPKMWEDLDATLLLFLGKLRRLEVRSVDEIVRYTRDDSGAITTLATERRSSSTGEEQVRSGYLRTTNTLDMSSIEESKREGIQESDLVLAFQLSEDEEAAPLHSKTYAFLPIGEFGFKFCIHGDFVLTANRESLHEDRPWNKRLRDSIAPTFVAALEEFKSRRGLSKSYMRFLPDDTDFHDGSFFRPVAGQIFDSLKTVECIPVESGAWCKPEKVLFVPSIIRQSIRKLFKSEDIRFLFGVDYPHPEFEVRDEILERLACRHWERSDEMSIFSEHSEWLAKKDNDWKGWFYAYLASLCNYRDVAELTDLMSKLPCLPTAEEGMVVPVPGTRTVFYPLSMSRAYGFEHELTILDSERLVSDASCAPNITI